MLPLTKPSLFCSSSYKHSPGTSVSPVTHCFFNLCTCFSSLSVYLVLCLLRDPLFDIILSDTLKESYFIPSTQIFIALYSHQPSLQCFYLLILFWFQISLIYKNVFILYENLPFLPSVLMT
jgi:hypothetical protein